MGDVLQSRAAAPAPAPAPPEFYEIKIDRDKRQAVAAAPTEPAAGSFTADFISLDDVGDSLKATSGNSKPKLPPTPKDGHNNTGRKAQGKRTRPHWIKDESQYYDETSAIGVYVSISDKHMTDTANLG